MRRGLLVLIFAAGAPGSLFAQSEPMSRTTAERELPLTTSTSSTDAREHLTAEDVLRALQRQRPRNTIIPPVDTNGAPQAKAPLLLPEGYSIVSRTGTLVPTDGGGRFDWSFRFDETDDQFPLAVTPVLPSATLEPMARSVASQSAASPPLRWEVTGELTVFDNKNYLLIHLAVAAPVALPAPPKSGGTGNGTGQPNAGVTPNGMTDPDTDAVCADASVEDVLSRMQGLDPIAPPVGIAQTSPALQRSESTDGVASATDSTTPHGWLTEGSAIVNRPCRLAQVGNWEAVAFESDHPEKPEPPMKVLPNLGLELLLEDTERRKEGAVFLVSGQMTSFEGENYLLLRNVRRRVVSGNFSK